MRVGATRRWANWRPDLLLLGAFLLCASCLWLFVEISDEVSEGETHGGDRLLLGLFGDRTALPHWFVQAMVDLTALGSTAVLTVVTLLCAVYLFAVRRHAAATWLVVAVAGGVALSQVLKLLFLRPRPDMFEAAVAVSTASYPSGHATNSAVVFLTLGAMLAREQQSRGLRVYVILAGILLTVIVGFSRVVLAVHWPSDVLGGWTLGAAWAAFCASGHRLFELRGRRAG